MLGTAKVPGRFFPSALDAVFFSGNGGVNFGMTDAVRLQNEFSKHMASCNQLSRWQAFSVFLVFLPIGTVYIKALFIMPLHTWSFCPVETRVQVCFPSKTASVWWFKGPKFCLTLPRTRLGCLISWFVVKRKPPTRLEIRHWWAAIFGVLGTC